MKAGVEQEAGELGSVAEWRGDHCMVSEPRKMSRTGKRMSPVWDMVWVRCPSLAVWGTGVCSEFQRGLSRRDKKSGCRHCSLTRREGWGERLGGSLILHK